VADHGATRAQADSVARVANPHGDDKLSSGHPDGEPVAAAREHSGRKLSDADG
jgi:hypothetical protein